MLTRSVLGVTLATTISLTTLTTSEAVDNRVMPDADTIADSVVRIEVGPLYCSGVAISPDWVLTSAGCVDIPFIEEQDVIVNVDPEIDDDQDTVTATVEYAPKQELGGYPDLALLNTNSVIDGPYAPLPTRSVYEGDRGYGFGFGSDEGTSDHVNSYDTIVAGSYGKMSSGYFSEIIVSVPVEGEIRPGDNGGPLFFDNELHGIFLHGDLDHDTGRYRDNYSVNISQYLDWIEETTGIDTVGNDTAASRTPSPRSTIGWSPSRPSTGYQNPMITDNGPNTNKNTTPTGQPSVSSGGSSS